MQMSGTGAGGGAAWVHGGRGWGSFRGDDPAGERVKYRFESNQEHPFTYTDAVLKSPSQFHHRCPRRSSTTHTVDGLKLSVIDADVRHRCRRRSGVGPRWARLGKLSGR
mmetsp:Transcript_44857/g.118459  ORF Transcript_44857/g.118459 Transcript_44857/m.118459 type:complete len:109 (+) Transcript_44857:20-346(+)